MWLLAVHLLGYRRFKSVTVGLQHQPTDGIMPSARNRVGSIENRNGAKLHRDCIPHPTCPCRSPAQESDCHGLRNPSFPAPSQQATIGHGISAGHRPDDGAANLPASDTPTGCRERAPGLRFRRSGTLSCTGWQVKDSNLRSFRDGFTVRPTPHADLLLLGRLANFAANSPQPLDVHRRLPALAGHGELSGDHPPLTRVENLGHTWSTRVFPSNDPLNFASRPGSGARSRADRLIAKAAKGRGVE
jgi:hypothetical protein